MCVVSMITDHYIDKWKTYPKSVPPIQWPAPVQITPEEIAEFKRLLERAKEYDKRTGQPDCELDSKRAKLKQLAKELGVEIEFV